MMQKQAKTIHPKAEQVLRQIILKDLENKGRKNWDKPHTEAVVHWIKELLDLLDNPELDRQVLVTAAYAHDWGYAGLFEGIDSRNMQNIVERKKLHMKLGAEKIERLLYQRLSRYYTEQQKLRIVHLVSVHDKVRELKDEDEILLMEADTLGMLDTDYIKPGLSADDEARFMKNSIDNLRYPRFAHEEARVAARRLIKNRRKLV